jgi:hypothetical protein
MIDFRFRKHIGVHINPREEPVLIDIRVIVLQSFVGTYHIRANINLAFKPNRCNQADNPSLMADIEINLHVITDISFGNVARFAMFGLPRQLAL